MTSYIKIFPLYFAINLKIHFLVGHWRIRGGRQVRAPLGSKFFHFHAVFCKNLKNNSNFGSWRTPWGNFKTAADPRFPRGCADPRRGVPSYLFAKLISENLHENEIVWMGGARPSTPWVNQCKSQFKAHFYSFYNVETD